MELAPNCNTPPQGNGLSDKIVFSDSVSHKRICNQSALHAGTKVHLAGRGGQFRMERKDWGVSGLMLMGVKLRR